MTFFKNCGYVLALSVTGLLLSANFALSSGAPQPEEEEDASGENGGTFPITSPTVRNPLPSDILNRMRKELMVLMGVPLENTEEDGAGKSHGNGQH